MKSDEELAEIEAFYDMVQEELTIPKNLNIESEIAEILDDYGVWCKCDSRECQKSVNYKQSKQALIELVAKAQLNKLQEVSREVIGDSITGEEIKNVLSLHKGNLLAVLSSNKQGGKE